MKERKRVFQIDLFRFIAALSVVLFHYLFRGNAADGMSILDFGELGEYFKYGYLGVDLFFIISGFVITLSIGHGSLFKFAVSRIIRLYPVYWLSVILTFSIIVAFGYPKYTATLGQLLFNLTMFQDYFGIESVDGVYWSLFVELKFYFLIALFLILNKVKMIRLDNFLLVWLLLSIAQLFLGEHFIIRVVRYLFILDWSAYFIAGVVFSQIYRNRLRPKHCFILLVCMALSIFNAVGRIEEFELHYNTTYSPYLIGVVIGIFYTVLFLISTHRLNSINSPKFLKLGLITYPLYLIHQVNGFIIFNALGPYLNKYVLVAATVLLMIIASYFISATIEPRLGLALRKRLNWLMAKTEPTTRK